MVTGGIGAPGRPALNPVDLVTETDLENVTTHPRLLVAETAKDPAMKQRSAIPILVQVGC